MGTILRKRFAFTSRDGIIEAYEAAFSRDETEVIGIVKDPVLFRLSCVRNVIVHKGGFVDEEFHRKMGKETRFSGVPIGEAIGCNYWVGVTQLSVFCRRAVGLPASRGSSRRHSTRH